MMVEPVVLGDAIGGKTLSYIEIDTDVHACMANIRKWNLSKTAPCRPVLLTFIGRWLLHRLG